MHSQTGYLSSSFVVVVIVSRRWTNDFLRATPHRIVDLPTHTESIPERYSIAFFANANKNVTIRPCLDLQGSKEPQYDDVNALDYLTQRLKNSITSSGATTS
jgi:isopenicillin N synthase-like dioxygenase